MTPESGRPLQQRCQAIRLLALDVDGVLTAGNIVHGTGGLEIKHFHVRDGSALKVWQRTGRRSAIITGRSSPVVDFRANEVGIGLVYQGAGAKAEAFAVLLGEAAVEPVQVCYVGDDLPDVPVLRRCGLAVAVADACPEARFLAHYITRAAGGQGAVREAIELILRCTGEWPAAC
jgi:3-deoxy-D-manno-octulosonate 8-phosphate phosphatase (KDO 8-P phosphatase)